MKINSITNYSQNKQQKPSFQAKATLTILEKGKDFSDEFVNSILFKSINYFSENFAIAKRIKEEGLNGVMFDFNSVSKEELTKFFSGTPKNINVKIED